MGTDSCLVVKQVLLLIIYTNQTEPKSKNILYNIYTYIYKIKIKNKKKTVIPFIHKEKGKESSNTLVGGGGRLMMSIPQMKKPKINTRISYTYLHAWLNDWLVGSVWKQ
jgi:hypothetical protein